MCSGEETMETGLIPLMDHSTYSTRTHNRVSDSTLSPASLLQPLIKPDSEPPHYSCVMLDAVVGLIADSVS